MKKYLYLILFFLVCVPAIAGTINSYTLKSPPDDADTIVIYDSDDGSTKKIEVGDISGSGAGINWDSYPDLTALTSAQEFLVNNTGTSSSINWEVVQTQLPSTGWTDSGTIVYPTTSTDNVGIGTTSLIAGNASRLNVYSTAAPTDSTTYAAYDLGYGTFNKYVYANDTNDVIWGLTGKTVNTGNASGIGHSIGVVGQASDTASGLLNLAGVEGRSDCSGNGDRCSGVLGLAYTDNGSYAGDMIGVYGVIVGSNVGRNMALYAPAITTGAGNDRYTLFGSNHIVTDSGNIGVGTSMPINRLQVGSIDATTYTATASNTANSSVYNNSQTNNTFSEFKVGQTNTNGVLASTGRIVFIHTNHTSGSETDEFALALKDSGTFGEKLRIKSNGNFGIGTTNPAQAFQVGTAAAGFQATTTGGLISAGNVGISTTAPTTCGCKQYTNGLCTTVGTCS